MKVQKKKSCECNRFAALLIFVKFGILFNLYLDRSGVLAVVVNGLKLLGSDIDGTDVPVPAAERGKPRGRVMDRFSHTERTKGKKDKYEEDATKKTEEKPRCSAFRLSNYFINCQSFI